MIDYAKLSVFDLLELKEIMERNLAHSENEAKNIAGLLEDKRQELERLEEIEVIIDLCRSAIGYIDEEIKKREI